MRQVSLTSNGDGTGRLEITIDPVRVTERKQGVYDVVSWVGPIPQKVRCGEEVLQAKMVLKMFCQSNKSTRLLKLKRGLRLRKLERLHAG